MRDFEKISFEQFKKDISKIDTEKRYYYATEDID